jgi:hypothetical protein
VETFTGVITVSGYPVRRLDITPNACKLPQKTLLPGRRAMKKWYGKTRPHYGEILPPLKTEGDTDLMQHAGNELFPMWSHRSISGQFQHCREVMPVETLSDQPLVRHGSLSFN